MSSAADRHDQREEQRPRAEIDAERAAMSAGVGVAAAARR